MSSNEDKYLDCLAVGDVVGTTLEFSLGTKRID